MQCWFPGLFWRPILPVPEPPQSEGDGKNPAPLPQRSSLLPLGCPCYPSRPCRRPPSVGDLEGKQQNPFLGEHPVLPMQVPAQSHGWRNLRTRSAAGRSNRPAPQSIAAPVRTAASGQAEFAARMWSHPAESACSGIAQTSRPMPACRRRYRAVRTAPD